MFKLDNPIQSIEEDLLNRRLFSKELARSILSMKSDKSIVIGLYGEWGSGKTSIINMVIENINNSSKKVDQDEKPIVIMFNPWNFADQNQLISQFFKQFSINLRKKDNSKTIKKIGELMEIYGNIFNLIPLYGNTISGMIKSAGRILKKYGIKNLNDLDAIKQELNKFLVEQKRKILIVIDDIDRLSNNEIKQIFQLVKSLGDFPNTIYLLSFDKQVIIKSLNGSDNLSAEKYLSKIIQIPFEVPLLNRRELEYILFKGFDELFKNNIDSKWDDVYWGNVYHSGIKYFFKTIRGINRYLNSLFFHFNLVKGEVNTIDFLAITAIQIFLPDLYYSIRGNKDLFSSSLNLSFKNEKQEIENIKTDIENIINSIETEIINRNNLKDLLKALFPKLETAFGNINYSNFEEAWSKDFRICSEKFFDRYFHLAVPVDQISQKEIKIILSLANDSEKFSEAILKLENNKFLDFMEKFESYTNEEYVSRDNIEKIVISFMDIADILPEYPQSFFRFDTSIRVIRVFKKLLDRIKDEQERYTILEKAIKNSERSLHIICRELSLREEEYNKNPKDIEKSLGLKNLDKLKEIICKKINNLANKNNLLDIKDLPYVLYRWKRWCNEKQVITTLRNLTIKDSNLIKFIGRFIKEQVSYGNGNYVGEKSNVIPFKEIGDFIDLNSIISRFRNLSNSEDFNKLLPKEKEIIKLFLSEIEKPYE